MTTKSKILYLDDESEGISGFKRLFNARSDSLEIVTDHPRKFAGRVSDLKQNIGSYVALILDLRLDQVPSVDTNEAAEYRAMTLAQELRTLAFEGTIKDLPIFLLTVEEKYNQSYKGDDTGHDLFDLSYSKTNFHEQVSRYEQKTRSFIHAYQLLDQARSEANKTSVLASLNLAEANHGLIDPKFASRYERILKKSPVHTIARFLHHKFIKPAGILLSEESVGARLGVDRHGSEDWPALLASITEFAGYTGPLGDGWRRWWNPLLSRWWDKEISPGVPFLSLASAERVALLSERTSFKRLERQEPIDPFYSTYYSMVCDALHKPLDPIDGYIVSEDARESWQEPVYVSGEALLHRAKYGFKRELEPNEEERFRAFEQNNAS